MNLLHNIEVSDFSKPNYNKLKAPLSPLTPLIDIISSAGAPDA